MDLLPVDEFEISSPLSLEDAVRALAEHVEPCRWVRLPGVHKQFEGRVSASGFFLQKIELGNQGGASSAPIEGWFEETPEGTLVKVRVETSQLWAFPIVGFLLITAVVNLIVLSNVLADPRRFGALALVLPITLLPFVALVRRPKHVIKRAERRCLHEIFQAPY